MPKFKGSCGCYNRDIARRFGVIAAVVYNDIEDKYDYDEREGKLVNGYFYLSQTNRADALVIPRKSYGQSLTRLEEGGLIKKKIGYKPGTTIKATWVAIIENDERASFSLGENAQSRLGENAQSIYSDTYIPDLTGDEGGSEDDVIPMAALTTHHVEVTVYDSDDNDKTITVKHQVSPKEWNKAVRKWRKDPTKRVMMEFKDTGETEHMTFRRIKKYNVRPQTQSLGYDRDAGTAFGVSHD